MNKVIFDTETTGVNTSKDRIVEISLIKIDKNLNIIDELEFRLNPTIPIPVGASDVHGITDEMVCDCPTFSDVASEIFEFILNCDLVGFNSDRFDIPLLCNEFKRVGFYLNLGNVQTVDVYKLEIKGTKNTLSDVYRRHTGKELQGAHGAKADTMATLEILKSQLRKMDLKIEEVEDYLLDGQPRLDLGGKLKFINGVICWNFGKHFENPITYDGGYVDWVLGADFPDDLKDILRRYA